MNILVTGDRKWDDEEHDFLIEVVLNGFVELQGPQNITLIEGGADGADTEARNAAKSFQDEDEYVRVLTFPADWKNGRAAGPMRNSQMLKAQPDIVIAFHDDLENSKGTKDMVNKATKAGVPTYLISRINPSK